MDDQGQGTGPPDLRLVRPPRRGLPPSADRLARLEMEERIRDLRMRGMLATAISRDVGVELKVVTATLRKFERDYKRRAAEQAADEAAIYRRRMIDQLERLKERTWQQLERAEDEKQKTRKEMLKGKAGETSSQRVTVDTLPGETSPALISQIREIELALGQLHGVELGKELPVVGPIFQKNEVLVIQPAAPLDMERLAKLQAAIKARINGGAEAPTLPPAGFAGNGDGT